MDFSINPNTRTLLDDVGQFISQELTPLEPEFLAGDWAATEQLLLALRDKVKARGWWGPNLPASLGGSDLSLVELGLLSEQLGASPFGHYVFGCQAPDAGNAELLHDHGSEQQKQQYLEPLAQGSIRSCFAMTEPATAGSNPTLLAASAVRDGDDYILNGRKWFTTAADGAAFTIAMMVSEPDAKPHERASMFLVDCNNPGFNRDRNISIMGESGVGYFSHSEVTFSDCRVPASALIGKPGQGFALAQSRLGPGRIHHCMRWLGIAGRALKMHAKYAKSRAISGSRTLADSDITKQRLAENAANIAAAKALVLQTAWAIENQGFRAARHQISMIKYHTAQVLQKTLDDALQAHGSLGVTDDTILAYFFRHERAARIYDGPDEVHQLSVARQLLK